MTILIAPEEVRGDVPGLLCRGMPVTWRRPDRYGIPTLTPDGMRGVVTGTEARGETDAPWVYVTWATGDSEWAPAIGVLVDWTDPAALDCSLRWLADRGHLCGWMRPRVYGGAVDDHGDLPAGTVSAILVARSVLEEAAGRGPVADLLVETCWGTAGCPPGITRYLMRSQRDGAGKYHADVGRRGRSRVQIDERPEKRAAALADNCALLVPGGVALSTLETR
jgi:hypothetical protein